MCELSETLHCTVKKKNFMHFSSASFCWLIPTPTFLPPGVGVWRWRGERRRATGVRGGCGRQCWPADRTVSWPHRPHVFPPLLSLPTNTAHHDIIFKLLKISYHAGFSWFCTSPSLAPVLEKFQISRPGNWWMTGRPLGEFHSINECSARCLLCWDTM